MNRAKLKLEAKAKVKGNKWYIWKPLVLFELILGAAVLVVSMILTIAKVDESTTETITNIMSSICSLLESIFAVGYVKYCLDFVRGKKEDWTEAVKFAKDHAITIFVVSLLVGLIITGCTLLLIIPGIIAAIGFSFYQEVIADNPDFGIIDIIKKSWALTKGHKMDLFVLGLSFLGWAILGALTLGILYIWLMPYMSVTYLLAYEKLKKDAK